MQDERFGNEQNDGKEQPHANHRVHPPKLGGLETIPKTKTIYYVEAGKCDDDYRGPRLPHEAALDCLKGSQSVGAEVAASDRGKGDRCCHRNTPDPDHDG